MTIAATELFRDYAVEAVPASGPHSIVKRDLRTWGVMLEAFLGAAGPGLGFTTRSTLYADLAHAANTLALVYLDSTAAYNGIYKKSGISGSGSWTRIGDLPSDENIVRLTVTGGTGNAITAESPHALSTPDAKLYLMTPTANNSGATTIAVNGGSAVAIKTAFGSALASGSLLNGSQVVMAWATDHYQLLIAAAIDGNAILADAVAARDDAEDAQAAAEAAAAALGNQAYTFDTYAQAEAATVPVGVKSIRLMGYYAAGDAPIASYYRVVSAPSTANKVRTTDRFLPNGTTSAGNGGWWQMVLDDITDVRKFGVIGDGSTDVTTKLQGAITAGSVVIPKAAAAYMLSTSIVTVPSNRDIWVRTGASIDFDGGRFSSNVPGGGNIHWRIDGDMYFHDTDTSATITGWGGGGAERGCIEMGGALVSPAGHFSVTGSGRIYSDYVYTTVGDTGLDDLAFQINRKGVAFFNCHDVLVEGLEVDHMHGEAVYHNGGAADISYNVQFLRNDVHHCRFSGLNFNTFYDFQQMVIAHNRVNNCFHGIEASTGNIHHNDISTVSNGIVTGGGGGVRGGRIEHNNIYSALGIGIDVEFDTGSPPVGGWFINSNRIDFAALHGILLGKITGFQMVGNTVYGHGSAGGFAYGVTGDASAGWMDGNVTQSPNGASGGNFINSSTGSSVGTNPLV